MRSVHILIERDFLGHDTSGFVATLTQLDGFTLQRIIDKTELQTKHQPRITQYFQTQNSTTPDIDSHSDVDQSEDYRGESD